METLNLIYYGFSVVLQPENIFFCFCGVFVGTLVGVLPGLGPTAAMSLLLPLTFYIGPVSSIIMLSGIYYGAQYGGSITSILLNIPGEASTVITCLDGHQMAKQGRAGPALGISMLGSFIAGTMATMGLMLVAPPLAKFALKFGPPEYFSLICLGMTVLIYLASKSIIKAFIMIMFGIILGQIGLDTLSGIPRLTFGINKLMDGLGIVPMAMGLFGISEILINVEEGLRGVVKERDGKIKGLLPNREDWKRSIKPILRGAFLGFFLGILPGGGSVLASFFSYGVEKRLSKNAEKFGTGMIEGVAGPEAANNSGSQASFIPMLTLGIPSNVIMAILIGALMINGVTPGPLLMEQHPEIFWGLITSMYLGNAMLLVLNIPLIGLWVKVLRVPYGILFPMILLFCLLGSYSLNFSTADIFITILFGITGYFMRKFEYEPAPLMLAFILGPMWDTSLRQSLLMSNGSFSIFFTRPISAISLGIMGFILMTALFLQVSRRRKEVAE